jgi:23S rRNA pseudouridine2605 synthase
MTERIQKIISASGLTSRRHAEELILAGRVTCNGRVCMLGEKADPQTDVIEVDGKSLPSSPKHIYILLNKPRGYVTTLQDEKGRKNAAQLVEDCGCRVYPVGRLDMNSEGLLLFTNDGEFANKLMHPRHRVDKRYRVWVRGYSPENLRLLERPVELDGYIIQPPQLKMIRSDGEKALIEITIHEGRNRQVRRMCDLAGMQVERLQRIAEGALRLGELPLGKWRYLTDIEVAELRKE